VATIGCLQEHASEVVNRLRALRGPGESYSDVILRLVEAKPN
jgi:predicted CopG family antitoxin